MTESRRTWRATLFLIKQTILDTRSWGPTKSILEKSKEKWSARINTTLTSASALQRPISPFYNRAFSRQIWQFLALHLISKGSNRVISNSQMPTSLTSILPAQVCSIRARLRAGWRCLGNRWIWRPMDLLTKLSITQWENKRVRRSGTVSKIGKRRRSAAWVHSRAKTPIQQNKFINISWVRTCQMDGVRWQHMGKVSKQPIRYKY